MARPKLSVIMSVYNGERYVCESVNSILTQTFQDFEFIIINDCSVDRTAEILTEYKNKKICVIRNSQNIGLTASLNIGLSVAKGEYIARMDVDDISITDRFERQVGFLENNLNYGLVGSNYYEINDFGKVIGEVLLPSSDLEIRNTIFKFNPYNHSSVIMRKNVIDRCGKYNEKYTMAQDYELWFRILAISKGRNLKEKLLLKRNPENSITKFRKKKQIYYSMLAWIRGRHYIDPKKIYYIYLIKLIFMYLIPSFAIPLLRRNFSREKQIRNGIYYSAKLEK